MKKFSVILALICVFSLTVPCFATDFKCETTAKSVILMEAFTGKVLYEQNADLPLPPASVTKVMSMLLIMEAIDGGKIKFDDIVTVSANAASMGGSQVFLKEGEQMTVRDLLKSIVVSSANDATLAMAEHIMGSEENFVAAMNEKAKVLGMKNTVFENTNGLDDTTVNHVTSAKDIAIMSRELITKHEKILEFSQIWTDTIRNGQFGLSNTNRLIRFYRGANGLKTGSTAKAGFCISATAKRDGTQFICVVMGAKSRDNRNETAKKVLDYAFANFEYKSFAKRDDLKIKVTGGKAEELPICVPFWDTVTVKGTKDKIKSEIILPEKIKAPVQSGQAVGKIVYSLNDEVLAELPISAAQTVQRLDFFDVFMKLLRKFCS